MTLHNPRVALIRTNMLLAIHHNKPIRKVGVASKSEIPQLPLKHPSREYSEPSRASILSISASEEKEAGRQAPEVRHSTVPCLPPPSNHRKGRRGSAGHWPGACSPKWPSILSKRTLPNDSFPRNVNTGLLEVFLFSFLLGVVLFCF